MIRFNINKYALGSCEVIHKALPDSKTAKTILHDMELNTLATGEIVHSYEMAFMTLTPRGHVNELYRIEEAQFA